jgi:hypothetical protein
MLARRARNKDSKISATLTVETEVNNRNSLMERQLELHWMQLALPTVRKGDRDRLLLNNHDQELLRALLPHKLRRLLRQRSLASLDHPERLQHPTADRQLITLLRVVELQQLGMAANSSQNEAQVMVKDVLKQPHQRNRSQPTTRPTMLMLVVTQSRLMASHNSRHISNSNLTQGKPHSLSRKSNNRNNQKHHLSKLYNNTSRQNKKRRSHHLLVPKAQVDGLVSITSTSLQF